MNENMSLEELKQQVVVWQQQVSAIQQRIEEVEKETSQKEEKKKTPWQLADVGGDGYCVDAYLDGTIGQGERYDDTDLNSFEKESVAKGFANAFSVMIQLRQCEGAGMFDHNGYGWLLDYFGDGIVRQKKDEACYSLFPPFPSYREAFAAAKSVGFDKIVAVYRFLVSGE